MHGHKRGLTHSSAASRPQHVELHRHRFATRAQPGSADARTTHIYLQLCCACCRHCGKLTPQGSSSCSAGKMYRSAQTPASAAEGPQFTGYCRFAATILQCTVQRYENLLLCIVTSFLLHAGFKQLHGRPRVCQQSVPLHCDQQYHGAVCCIMHDIMKSCTR